MRNLLAVNARALISATTTWHENLGARPYLLANKTQEPEGGNLIEFITDTVLREVAARGSLGEVRLGVHFKSSIGRS